MSDQKIDGRKNNGRKKGQKQPSQWISGPDETRHQQHIVWRQAKNQAQFRNEGWDIDFEDWILIWGLNWDKRGRKPDHYCMTRIDITKPWVNENVKIVRRGDLLSEQAKGRCINRWINTSRTPEEQLKYEKNKEYQANRKAKLLRLAKGEE